MRVTRTSEPALIAALLCCAAPGFAQDANDAGDPTAAAPTEQPGWRNSQFAWTHSVTKNTLSEGAQLTYNPTYVQALQLLPRWYLRDDLSLRLRQDFIFEFTEPDGQNDRFLAQDTVLDAVYGTTLMDNLSASAGPRVALPLSVVSRAARRMGGLGARAAIGYAIPGVLSGMGLELGGSYLHYFARSNVPASDDRELCATAGRGGGSLGYFYCGDGATSVRDRMLLNAEVSVAVVDTLSVSLGFGGSWQYGHSLADAEVPTAVGTLVLDDASATHFRNGTMASLSIAYALQPGIEIEFGGDTSTSQLSENGQRRNPLWNPETQLSLSLVLQPDAWISRDATHPDAL